MARLYAANGRHYRKEAEGMPLLMLMMKENGEYTMLTHQERAFLKMTRALPDDLRPKFDEALRGGERPFKERLEAFKKLLEPRLDEYRERWERITRGESLEAA